MGKWWTGVPPVPSKRQREGSSRIRTNHIRLILRYRQESLTDITSTYPAKSKPTVPSVFRTALNALIVSPFKQIRLYYDASSPKKEAFRPVWPATEMNNMGASTHITGFWSGTNQEGAIRKVALSIACGYVDWQTCHRGKNPLQLQAPPRQASG